MSSKITTSFGSKVKSVRNHKGYSQEELGFRAKLDRTYISGVERGTRNPSLDSISRIARALAIKLRDLFSDL
jgi:transcriptional regulator with XRE-family HTH domain